MEAAAAVIVIGNEILSGKVRDANSPFLVVELHALGLPVGEIRTVPDDVESIARAVRELAGRFEQVLTSGGVGPTLDDVTYEGVAKAFGLGVLQDPALEKVIRDHLGSKLAPGHLRMARIPEQTRLIWPEGMLWPVTEVRNVLVLPGDPALLREKFAAVRERFRAAPFHLRCVFTTLDEGDLAAHLDRAFAAHPEVALGSYPVYDNPEYRVQITLEGKDGTAVEAALEEFLRLLDPAAVVRVDPAS